jgi:chromosomal replication initiator protein
MNGVWEEVKEQIRSEIPDQSFSLWIKPITFLEQRDDALVVGCPNKFSRNWVMDNYAPLLEKKLEQLGGAGLRVSLQVTPVAAKPSPPRTVRESGQLSFPSMRRRGLVTARWLKNNLTFDRFVVGKCNEFAYSVSRSLSFGEDTPYTPLFMLSNTGLGKSHLAQAIGHAFLSRDPNTRVCYITAEDFVNEMIFCLKNNRIEEFKNKYRRGCDVLLLEEVHFLSGKEKTQKELEYTLDALINDRKKIILTSAVLPKDIPNLSKEMESRLTSGIITTIDRPDYETRLKMLEKKAAEKSLKLTEEAIQLIAKHLSRDVRQIESALSCLKAKTELLKQKISRSLIMDVIKCHVSEVAGHNLEDIMALVCKYFDLDADILSSKSRKKNHAYPRNLYAYLCRNHTDATLEEIGATINRNHSTVLYASEVIATRAKTDRNVRKQVDFFKERLEKSAA